ncbi:MAG: hypothetical protein ACYC5S_00860 [Thiobacillus sp.]
MRTDPEIDGTTTMAMKTRARPVLFGAFDRHNFGDLLFPHLLTALLPDHHFAFCGLAARDLRRFGGHRVTPLAPGAPHLVHVGGERLTCGAWQAAVMLRDPGETDALADGLREAAAASGLGIVLFHAGAAPWHDDPALYENVCARLPQGCAGLFTPLHVWDICALIAASRGTIASSLHARIAALAFALPRVSLRKPQAGPRQPDTVAAFAETWEPHGLPHGVEPAEIGNATARALATPVGVLRDNAQAVCAACRASLAQWAGLLGPTRLGQRARWARPSFRSHGRRSRRGRTLPARQRPRARRVGAAGLP